jgi:hypothetical protein
MNLWSLLAIEPWFLGRPSHSLFAVPTELYRLISFHELVRSVKAVYAAFYIFIQQI